MKTPAAAENLATSLVKTAQAMGKKAVALLTDMETPLGLKTGNYLEIEESLECLQGNGPKDVMELTYALASRMALLAGKVASIEEGLELCKQAVDSGRALEKFLKNVDDQGGDSKKLLEQQGKRRSPFHAQLNAESDGYLKIDAYKTGIACINLGVGRNKTSDKVDADSGIILSKVQGEAVKAGQKIMDVYAKDEKSLEEGVAALKKAVSYSKTTITQNKLILKEIK